MRFVVASVASVLVASPVAGATPAGPELPGAPVDFVTAFCAELLTPARADRFVSHLSLEHGDARVVEAIASQLVEAARPGEHYFAIDAGRYEVRGLLVIYPTEIRVQIARFARATDAPAHGTGVRSPLLDVWRGLALALFQISRSSPNARRVVIDGFAMNNRKYVRLLRQRVAFYQPHMGEADYQLALWNRPDARATLRHRAAFAARGLAPITRRLVWVW